MKILNILVILPFLLLSCATDLYRSPASQINNCQENIHILLEIREGSNATIERKLREMPILPNPRFITEGMNDVFLLTLEDGTRAVFKPHQGAHNDIASEISSYKISKFFAIDQVPPTVERNYQGVLGSLQLFIENARTGFFHTPIMNQEEELREVLLDYIIANQDRYDQNFLINERGNLFSIDHGRAFHTLWGVNTTVLPEYINNIMNDPRFIKIRNKILNVTDKELHEITRKLSQKKRSVFLKRMTLLKSGEYLD